MIRNADGTLARNADGKLLRCYGAEVGGQPSGGVVADADYGITGYTDGDLQPCGTCLDTSSYSLWDGRFYYRSSAIWLWYNAPVAYPDQCRMAGKRLHLCRLALTNEVYESELPADFPRFGDRCFLFVLDVLCKVSTVPQVSCVVWRGFRPMCQGGAVNWFPTGTYYRGTGTYSEPDVTELAVEKVR